MTYQLKIIIASTRPERKGHLVAEWFTKIAEQYSEFEIEVLDLKMINLPLLDEPNHPKMKKYLHEHTLHWSNKINEADAYVMVTPEYNYNAPATLKNALDFLFTEWEDKPVAFVSYGGISAGTRAVQDLKSIVTSFSMMPLLQAVNIPFFNQFITEEQIFEGNEILIDSAHVMLKKLSQWAKALKTMRNDQ